MAVRPSEIPIVSLFAGAGGLDRGVKLALPATRVVLFVEREIFAAAILAKRMQEGQLDDCPIWSDAKTCDYSPWRGRVSGVIAGFPCQPSSIAGKRAGLNDERWLWPEVRRAYRDLGARWVFLENVPGLITVSGGRGFGEVLANLAEDGFAAEWLCLQAAEVGASHRRERLFVLAMRDAELADRDSGGQCQRLQSDGGAVGAIGGNGAQRHDFDGCRETLGDPDVVGRSGGGRTRRRGRRPADASAAVEQPTGERRGEGRTEPEFRGGGSAPCGTGGELGDPASEREREPDDASGAEPRRDPARRPAGGSGGGLGDPDDTGLPGRGLRGCERTDRLPAEQGGGPLAGLPAFPPGPGLGLPGTLDHIVKLFATDPDAAWRLFEAERANTLRWIGVLERWPWLAPALSEAQIEYLLHRVVNGMEMRLDFADRIDRLRLCGNGVVVQQCAAAVRILAARAGLNLVPTEDPTWTNPS